MLDSGLSVSCSPEIGRKATSRTALLPLALLATSLLTGCLDPDTQTAGTSPADAPNVLTQAELSAGWQLLFDGESTNGWRGYNRDSFPTRGWRVENGELLVEHSGEEEAGFGGDIVTEASFEDFELKLDFLLTDTANSGILYRVIEQEGSAIWHNAPEYQLLDDSTYIAMGSMDMKTHLTGDNYDLHSAASRPTNPIGEWNTARIIVDGQHVEHWLNGVKTVEYEIGSPEWEALVAKSKFSEYPAYGRTARGPIGLQDHGHLVKFRNIKIRPIPSS